MTVSYKLHKYPAPIQTLNTSSIRPRQYLTERPPLRTSSFAGIGFGINAQANGGCRIRATQLVEVCRAGACLR